MLDRHSDRYDPPDRDVPSLSDLHEELLDGDVYEEDQIEAVRMVNGLEEALKRAARR